MKFKLNKNKEIVKYNFEKVYNPSDYTKVKNQLLQREKELNSQLSIYNLEVKKAKETLPKINDLDEKEIGVIWFYQDRMMSIKKDNEELKQIKKGLKTVLNEMKEIEKQTGIKFK